MLYGKKLPMVVGFLNDKPWQQMVVLLKDVADTVITTTPDSERKLPAEELAVYMKQMGFNVEEKEKIAEAVARCREIAAGDKMVVTGSFFIVGEAINESVRRNWVDALPNSAEDVLD